MWPAVLHGGRPKAAGQLPAGSAIMYAGAQRRQNNKISCRPPAGGGQNGGAAGGCGASRTHREQRKAEDAEGAINHDRRGAARLA